MATTQLSPTPVFKAFDNNGNPLFNGQLFTYAAGTSTPQTTYTDSTGNTANTNPVILNSRGEANVWLNPNLAYKFVLEDANGTTIWTVDNITAPILQTPYGVTTGTNTISVSTVPSFSSLTDGLKIEFKISNTTTATATLNANSTGALNIYDSDGLLQLVGGQLVQNTIYTAIYNSSLNSSSGGWSVQNVVNYQTMFNAKTFGAAGDGVTDDTTAIQNAINSASTAGGGTVYFPKGNYIVTGLTLAEGVFLEGDGYVSGTNAWATKITQKTGSASDVLALNVGGGSHLSGSSWIRNLWITANSTSKAINLNAVSFVNMTNVRINGGQYGLYLTEVWDSEFQNVLMNASTATCVSINPSTTDNCNNLTFRHLHCESFTVRGLEINGSTGSKKCNKLYFYHFKCESGALSTLTGTENVYIAGCAHSAFFGGHISVDLGTTVPASYSLLRFSGNGNEGVSMYGMEFADNANAATLDSVIKFTTGGDLAANAGVYIEAVFDLTSTTPPTNSIINFASGTVNGCVVREVGAGITNSATLFTLGISPTGFTFIDSLQRWYSNGSQINLKATSASTQPALQLSDTGSNSWLVAKDISNNLLFQYNGTNYAKADPTAVSFSILSGIIFNANGGAVATTLKVTAATPTAAAGQLALGTTTSATATAGAATLPANPVGFIVMNLAGTVIKLPYYNT